MRMAWYRIMVNPVLIHWGSISWSHCEWSFHSINICPRAFCVQGLEIKSSSCLSYLLRRVYDMIDGHVRHIKGIDVVWLHIHALYKAQTLSVWISIDASIYIYIYICILNLDICDCVPIHAVGIAQMWTRVKIYAYAFICKQFSYFWIYASTCVIVFLFCTLEYPMLTIWQINSLCTNRQ